MMSPMSDPMTRDDLVASFEQLARTGAEFWNGFAPDVFVAPIGEAWSPADNVRHLIKSTKPVGDALRLPRIVPKLLFGRPSGPSRSFAEIRGIYREALAGGATAGRFAPSEQPAFTDAAAFQTDVIASWSEVVGKLALTVAGLSEAALDASRLPHPVIGKLTVREMLYFTLYHHEHHAATVTRRLSDAVAGADADINTRE
jgi:hypothetical protein